jgi:cysteine peptidase C11 family protein
VGSSADVKVVVELGRPLTHYYNGDPTPWSGVKRFLVMKHVDVPEGNVALSDLGPADMGVGQTLKDFVTWGTAAFPAENTMLIIWDHGQGYRLQLVSNRPHPPYPVASLVALSTGGQIKPNAPPRLGGVKAVSYDQDTGHILYNRDIEDSLKASLGGKKLQIIAFDACLMSMVETAYAMRDVSSFFVGSEEEEPGPGWDYSRFLSPLVAHPSYTPSQVSTLSVAAYQAEYGQTPSQTTMSAIDESKISALANAIGDFASSAQPLLANNVAAFRQARSSLVSYGYSLPTHVSVDLILLTSRIAQAYSDPNLTAKAVKIKALVSEAVLKAYASSDMVNNYGSFGLAIFFPATANDFQTDPDSSGYSKANTLFPIEFVNDEVWSDLVNAYVQLDIKFAMAQAGSIPEFPPPALIVDNQ